MTPEAARQELKRQLEAKGVDMATASKAIGRNHAYLQQFIATGKPRWLHEHDRRALAEMYKVNTDSLVPPAKRSVQRQVPLNLSPSPGDPIHDFREASVVGVWRRLPQEDQDIFVSILDGIGRRRNLPPIAL